jgi:hypothetical protein
MENNQILDATEVEVQYVTTTPVEKWVGYAEYAFLFLIILGTILKIQSIQYASEILTISFWGYALLFLVFARALLQSRTKLTNIIANCTGIAAFLLLCGMLFKIQSWQYGTELLTIGLFFIALIIIINIATIWYIGQDNLSNKRFRSNVLVRLLAFGALKICIFLLILYKILKPRLFREN